MSSGENVELVRGVFAAFAARDFDAITPMLDPELEIRPAIAGSPEGVVYHGPEGMREFWTQVDAVWDARRATDPVRELHAPGGGARGRRHPGVAKGPSLVCSGMGAFSDTEFDLEPQRVKELVEGGEAQLIDVREDYEWEAGRIAGAVHMNLERLGDRTGEIDKETPVIFQCRVGNRSSLATQAFRAAGYDAYNLTGGLEAWVAAGLPLEPEGGKVASH